MRPQPKTDRQWQRQFLADVAEVRWRNDPESDFDPRDIDPEWVPPNTLRADGQDLRDAYFPTALTTAKRPRPAGAERGRRPHVGGSRT